MRGRSIVLMLAVMGLTACATLVPPPPRPVIPAFLAAAVGDPNRPATDVERDIDRKPADTLAFAGVTPGMKIGELVPGGGYFTRILSKAVGPYGHVYAYVPDELTKMAKRDPAVKAVADDPNYKNVTMIVRKLPAFSTPEKLDMVWTSQNYHDMHAKFMGPVDVAAMNKAIFKQLKPGGVYLVLDHADDVGRGVQDVDSLHRIDPTVVRQEVEAAGFIFEGESTILRNPSDTHKVPVFDPSVRGHTDQFIYKFRKPRGAH